MSEKQLRTADKSRIDWMITLVPFILIMALAVYSELPVSLQLNRR